MSTGLTNDQQPSVLRSLREKHVSGQIRKQWHIFLIMGASIPSRKIGRSGFHDSHSQATGHGSDGRGIPIYEIDDQNRDLLHPYSLGSTPSSRSDLEQTCRARLLLKALHGKLWKLAALLRSSRFSSPPSPNGRIHHDLPTSRSRTLKERSTRRSRLMTTCLEPAVSPPSMIGSWGFLP